MAVSFNGNYRRANDLFCSPWLSLLCTFIKNPGSDITEVVEEHFGKTAGKLITLLYFFAIFPILLIYGNGITNTVDSFIVNQLGMASPNRVILSLY